MRVQIAQVEASLRTETLVQGRINPVTYSTWFKSTSFISDDGTALRIGVPNGLFRDWFMKHYAPIVEQVLAELDRGGTPVNYVEGSISPGESY